MAAAVDALVAFSVPRHPSTCRCAAEATPCQAYDRAALQIEIELLIDWYWPALHGEPAPDAVRAEFLSLWSAVFDRLERQPPGWVLRDFHSPNLIWLPERDGIRRVGVLDFQDAQRGPPAYDLVSLLQDARVDVSEALEKALFAHYCAGRAKPPAAFRRSGIHICLQCVRRPAQHQDPRHFRAAGAA